jgi:hypothetical protein
MAETPPCLPYATIRPQLQSGDLLLCCGSAPFSKMIQAATGSPFSHVAMLWYARDLGRWLVYESVESIGLHFVTLRRYVTNYADTGKPYPGTLFIARHRDFPTDLSTQSMFRGPSADRLGSAYDNRQIAAIALRIVGAKLGLSPREARDDSIFICSEAIDERYRNFGLQVPFDPAGYVAPRHFAEWDAVTLLWEIDTSQGDPRHAVAPPAPAQP